VIRLVPASLVACALLAPASAAAAGFGALPALPVEPAGRCLRATGAPGELVRWRAGGAELVQATSTGFGATTRVPLGDVLGCPSAAGSPSGAGVLAAAVNLDDVGIALRDPGGSWTRVRRIPMAEIHDVESLATAVSDRGDALVVWSEGQEVGDGLGARIRAVRRTAGGRLGAPVPLSRLHAYHAGAPTVSAGMQADGTAIVLWTQDNPDLRYRKLAFVAVAPPGRPFGRAQRLSGRVERTPALAVAPDGRALAVVPETHRTAVLERPPGGVFARVAVLGAADVLYDRPAVALRPGGAAIVAWADFDTDRIFAIRRDQPGRFGRAQPLGPIPEDYFAAALALEFGEAPGDLGGRAVRAVFAGDGRPVVTWGAVHTLGSLTWAAASVATRSAQTLSGPLRNADSIAPVILAGGTAAVAWSDVAPGGGSLLHLAPEGGGNAPRPPPPRVETGRITQLKHRLSVTVRCSAACDVRASVPGGSEGAGALSKAGTTRLQIDTEDDPIEVPASGRVPIQFLSGATGDRHPRMRTLRVRLRAIALPHVQRLSAGARW